jgi:hypothetical protein
MAAAGETVPAAAAYNVTFTTDNVADQIIVYIRTDRDDFADELVTDRKRHRDCRLRPFVPFENMQICSTDSGLYDPDQNIIDSNRWLGYILEPQAALGAGLH